MDTYTYDDSILQVIAGAGIVATILFLVICICAIVAYFLLIGCLVRAAKAKGFYTEGAGKLWFIGIFGTPLLLALSIIALPDHSDQVAADQAAQTGYPQFPQGYTQQ